MALLRAGATVLATGRNEEALARVAERPRASWFVADATDAAAVAELRAVAERRRGPVDLLVAAAGGGGRPGPFGDLTLDEWDATVSRNLTSTYLALHEFVPAMADRAAAAVLLLLGSGAEWITGHTLNLGALSLR